MEEFTFPCVPVDQCSAQTLPFPRFASSRPPWLVSGTVDTSHDHRRSFSAVESPQQAAALCSDQYRSVAVAGGGRGGYPHHGSARYAAAAEEHRMDMLWEDFNEELARAAPPCPLTKGTPSWSTTREESSWLAGDGDDDDCCVTRNNHAAVVWRRRMGLLAMLRLLKKLFLAHKSGATASRKAPPI